MSPASHDDAVCPEPLPAELSAAEPPGPRAEPQLSHAITVFSAIVLIAGLAAFVWLQLSIPRLERVPNPERALTLLVEHTMDLEEVIERAPAWEQALYDLGSGGRAEELNQAITWFEDLASAGGEPRVRLQLGVLHGEAGHLDRIQADTHQWKERQEPFPTYARLLTAAYLVPRLARSEELTLQAEVAEALPQGWFYDRLAHNLAAAAGDIPLMGATEAAMVTRAQPLLRRTRILALTESTAMVIGCLALVGIWKATRSRPRAGWLRMGKARLPPCWRGRVAVAVLARGGALGVIVIALFLIAGTDDPLFRLAAIPVSNLPLLVLARRYLLAPAGLGLGNGLGLTFVTGSSRRIGIAVVAALAAGMIGEWAIDRVAMSFDMASHWTEWFDPDLVWGAAPVLITSFLEYVVLAPFFEELVFRGMLFSTLRRRFAWGPSALISAGIFAAAHGYGVLGFASVLWSGMIWAWVYEATGSLWPGMVAHALNNLMVCVTLIALLHW